MLSIITIYTLIILEGGVCSGKTTLSKKLSNNFFTIPEQTEFIPNDIEKKVFNMGQDIISTTILNIDHTRYELAKNLLKKNINVVMDRSILSTFSFYYITNQFMLVNNIFYREIHNLKQLNPIIFYIKIPYNERLKRILNRNDNDLEKIKNSIIYSEKFNTKFDDFFINFLKKYDLNIIVIDGLLPANEIINLIKIFTLIPRTDT